MSDRVKLIAPTAGEEADLRSVAETGSHAAREGLLLKNEAGLRRENPPWRLVEKVVREINEGFGNSFCILGASGGHYIQTLRGFNGYHLEWRCPAMSIDKGYFHYRGCYPGGSSKVMELKKHNHVSPGEHRDLLLVDDVVDGFRAFYFADFMPGWLDGRVLEI